MVGRSLQLHTDETVQALADEIEAIIAEASFSAKLFVIETNHKIGESIVEHTAYQKGKHGSGALIKLLAEKTGRSEQHLYLCVKFYEQYPQVSHALETLQGDAKALTWRHVVRAISGSEESPPDCPHKVTFEIRYTCCRACGSKIKK